jgi:hypothetical protein
MIAIPLPDIEVSTPQSVVPNSGSRTQTLRVIDQEMGEKKIKLTVEGTADNDVVRKIVNGSVQTSARVYPITLVRHRPVDVKIERSAGVGDSPNSGGAFVKAAEMDTALHDPKIPVTLYFHFGPGEGWQTITVTLTW